jgi:hypothetical protein
MDRAQDCRSGQGDQEHASAPDRSIVREIAKHEIGRDELRQALEAVVVQTVANMDDLTADCRRASLETKANFAGLMVPIQVHCRTATHACTSP